MKRHFLLLSFFGLLIGFCISCSSQKRSLVADAAELTLAGEGFKFTEGPAADTAGNVYFTDQPKNRIHKWSWADGSISLFMEDAGRANGLYFDREGNLLACADEHSELWKISMAGHKEVLVEDFSGKRLNGPNDLWVDKKGGIYFTDPYYQRPYWERSEKEILEERVYYLTPDRRELCIAATDLVKPNGIIGTPDGKSLYIADIGDDKTWKYMVNEDGSLGARTLFTSLGSDGMTIDEAGNVYLTGKGVSVFDKEGKQILHIPVEREWTANLSFGGENMRTLFITAMDAVFTLEMNVKGVR